MEERVGLGIEEILAARLGDPSFRFVFPSEICAEDWLGRALYLGEDIRAATSGVRAPSLNSGARAIEADRFLGWDRFKEKASERAERPPVDDCMRRIFAASILAENAASPFLSSLLPPEYASEWPAFALYVASRLSTIGALPATLDAAGITGSAQGANPRLADWLELRKRYEAFLERIGRCEPSFEPKALRDLPGSTVIFFPELIEDFDAYRAILERCPSVRLVSLPSEAPELELRRPETALSELRETLSEIGELIDGGMEAADIAITVAGLERYRPYLEREAALLSVPLALRSGSPLASTPGGRLFAAMRDAASSGFSFDSLRDLLLSPAWPWKSPELGKSMIREGMRLHAVAPWPESDGSLSDAWERSLKDELKGFYRNLRRGIKGVTGAKDFASILKSYNAFKGEFLSQDEAKWDETADLTLARCIVELEKLKHAQKATGLETGDAFGLFMRSLESTQYVSAKAAPGVSVYDWRVGAGIRPKRHFFIHASQEALVARYRGFDFLGESLREALGSDRDAAAQFIEAYARSGEDVVFSCPIAGFDGEEAAHGSLVSLAREEASVSREARPDRAYREEGDWLAGRGDRPPRLHKAQVEGLKAAGEARAVVSGSGAFLEPGTADLAAAELVREGEAGMSLDATAVDYYLSCPYAYLYLRILRAGPEASGISFVDAFFLGDVYHAALERLFARIKEEDGRFRPERVEDYRAFLPSCLGEAFSGLARKRGAFVAVVLEAYRGRLEAYLSGLLDTERERFPNLEIGRLEEELELAYPGLTPRGVVLRGRIDRISRSDKGEVIVDYKKGRVPDKAQVAPDETRGIAKAQIPCYLRLVTAAGDGSGEEVDSAWYLSIEGSDKLAAGQAVCAFGEVDAKGKGAYVGKDGLEALLEAFDAALGDTARGVTEGAYPLAPKEAQKEACRECGARGICRERYALRFGQRPAAAAREGRS